MGLQVDTVRPDSLYHPDVPRAMEILREFSETAPQAISLSRQDRQLFYNKPEVYLQERFVQTDLFQEVYQIALDLFHNVEDTENSHDSKFAGALFQAYGILYLMQSPYVQPGFKLIHDRQRRLKFFREAMFIGVKQTTEPFEYSFKNTTSFDAMIIVDTESGSYIQHECEITLTDRNDSSSKESRNKGHFDKSLAVFDMRRDNEERSALYTPSATLLYVIPQDLVINSSRINDQEVEILRVPVDKRQWGEFMKYVLFEYRIAPGEPTLGELYESAQGKLIPRRDTVRALLYPVDVTRSKGLDEEVAEGPVDTMFTVAGITTEEETWLDYFSKHPAQGQDADLFGVAEDEE